jgi:hypothetical protein
MISSFVPFSCKLSLGELSKREKRGQEEFFFLAYLIATTMKGFKENEKQRFNEAGSLHRLPVLTQRFLAPNFIVEITFSPTRVC